MDKINPTQVNILITNEEVHRVQAVGELLFSALSLEKIEGLKDQLSQHCEIRNTGDS